MIEHIENIVVSQEQLIKTVQRLGRQIGDDYKGKNLLLVCILKGSIVFTSDLMRAVNIPCKMDFMMVSSYIGTKNSGGNVSIVQDLNIDIKDFDVLIVEDILESGYTLSRVTDMLKSREPHSLEICTLLDKPNCRKTNIQARYVGHVIPDDFVVGYGLDYNESYRSLPFIGTLKPKYISRLQ